MDVHSLKVLEFDKIRSFLKTYAPSAVGKNRCDALMPLHHAETIKRLLGEVTEMRGVLDLHGHIPIRGVHDIEHSVEQSRISNFYLEPKELLDIKETLETARAIRDFFSGLDALCPLLQAATRDIVPIPDIEYRVRQSISSQGSLLDTASPELAEIRGRIKSLRSSILAILERMIADESLRHVFQEDFITLRNNRYVLLVRSDCKSAVPGVVHDQSQSKATFFIEPLAAVNLNNELQILRKEETYEEIRILTELTGLVNHFQHEILADLALLERVEVIYAKALFSAALNAREPRVNSKGVIELKECRHPILLAQFVADAPKEEAAVNEGQDTTMQTPGHWEFNRPGVVPIDLIKDDRTSTLIITGANAGGKTVALKTLGLFTLMVQAGMHIPVQEGSTLSVYESVFADIGDEQNIEASLSTFSAHVVRIDLIVRQAQKTSLVLLDELGAGTDPTEGSALALGILDLLRESGCFTVVTSHLNLIKAYAYLHDDVQNVSVEFDPVTLKPQFRLAYGMPGVSNALAIARNLGMAPRILERAHEYLEDSDRQILQLIRGLEQTQQGIFKEQQEIRAIKERALEFEKKTREVLEKIKSSRERILKDFERDAKNLLKKSEQELMKIIDGKKKKIYVRPGEEKEELLKVKKELYEHFPKTALPKESVEHLCIGQVVRVSSLQKEGIVSSVDDAARKVEITIGTMKIKAGFNDLELPERQPHREPAPKTEQHPAAKKPLPQAAAKVTVIGMRVDEALPVVDKAIDQALVQGADRLEIIHGVGTGRLMKAIREYLETHSCVSQFFSGDVSTGGAGITIVEVKG